MAIKIKPTEVIYTKTDPNKKNKPWYTYKRRIGDDKYPISLIDECEDVEITMTVEDLEWIINCHYNAIEVSENMGND